MRVRRFVHYGEHVPTGTDYGGLTSHLSTVFADPIRVVKFLEKRKVTGLGRGELKKLERDRDPGQPLDTRLKRYIGALRFGYSLYEAEIIADYGWTLNLLSFYTARISRLAQVVNYLVDRYMNPKSEENFRWAAEEVAERKGFLTLWDILDEGISP